MMRVRIFCHNEVLKANSKTEMRRKDGYCRIMKAAFIEKPVKLEYTEFSDLRLTHLLKKKG
jgi:hypothetical protein